MKAHSLDVQAMGPEAQAVGHEWGVAFVCTCRGDMKFCETEDRDPVWWEEARDVIRVTNPLNLQ